MNQRKQQLAMIVPIMILLLIGVVYNADRWMRYSACRASANIIEYGLVEVNHHKGGRGDYYTATILSQGERHELDVTSKMAAQLEQGIALPLYRCSKDDVIFSEWTVSLKLRLSLLFAGGFVVFMIVLIRMARRNCGKL